MHLIAGRGDDALGRAADAPQQVDRRAVGDTASSAPATSPSVIRRTRAPASRIASMPSSWRGRSSTTTITSRDVGALALGDQLDASRRAGGRGRAGRRCRRRRPSSPCRRTGPGSNIVPRSDSAITASAFGHARARHRRVPSSGSTAMSTSRRRAVADLLAVVRASAPRPSRPRRSRRCRPCGSCASTACMPSTAAWSAASLSPGRRSARPRSAAASVTRTSSSARLRSGGMRRVGASEHSRWLAWTFGARWRAYAPPTSDQDRAEQREEPAEAAG